MHCQLDYGFGIVSLITTSNDEYMYDTLFDQTHCNKLKKESFLRGAPRSKVLTFIFIFCFLFFCKGEMGSVLGFTCWIPFAPVFQKHSNRNGPVLLVLGGCSDILRVL